MDVRDGASGLSGLARGRVGVNESIIADFRARLAVEREDSPEPGRVVLGRSQLVLVRPGGRTTIPLSSVFDLAVGEVPPGASDFFDHTVTVGYQTGEGDRRTATIEAKESVVDRFASVTFRAILSGTEALVKHPARIGGRVTDAAAERATLSLCDGGITVGDCRIDLSTVVHFERGQRTLGGARRPTLSIRHFRDDGTVTTELTLPSKRRLNVLGRYLRLEYTEALAAVRELSLSEAALEALVALYSGGEVTHLPGVLGVDSGQVAMLLNDLAEKGLVDAGGALTAHGRMTVADRIESVNV